MGAGTSSASGSWKSQLRQMAKKGQMPQYIMGDKDHQAEVLIEIDRLYDMPKTNATIIDQGDRVWVNFGGRTAGASYPHGTEASEEEKRGALKKLLHNKLQK